MLRSESAIRATLGYVPVKANTKEETAAELAAKPDRWRIYADGGCDDSGNGKESGVAGWGGYIEEIDVDGNIVQVASLWGPVGTDQGSRWFMGSPRETNHTGELNGDDDDDVDGLFNVSLREPHCLTCMRKHA